MDAPVPLASVQAKIAEAIRVAMARRQLTAAALVERTGIAQATLSRKLRGITPFTVPELAALASALDVPMSEIVAEAETALAG